MRKSLNALLECPQNNLRIFRNGHLIYGDQVGSITLEELKENFFNGYNIVIVVDPNSKDILFIFISFFLSLAI